MHSKPEFLTNNRKLKTCFKVIVDKKQIKLTLKGAAKKRSPLKSFAVLSATIWNFNLKFYSFTC